MIYAAELPIGAPVAAAVVTLAESWVAEQYAELAGGQAEGGRRPAWPHIRTAPAATWPIASASLPAACGAHHRQPDHPVMRRVL